MNSTSTSTATTITVSLLGQASSLNEVAILHLLPIRQRAREVVVHVPAHVHGSAIRSVTDAVDVAEQWRRQGRARGVQIWAHGLWVIVRITHLVHRSSIRSITDRVRQVSLRKGRAWRVDIRALQLRVVAGVSNLVHRSAIW